ncbi:MAG: hypothetical protein J6Q44_01000 [Alphaproteobacteria bacterium]|nr:hypothetical protein [Alphaproteobacteria bacterium]
MKKFNRFDHKNMGSLPEALRKIAAQDARAATREFNALMTELATDFIAQLSNGTQKNKITLTASRKLFGQDVKLEYVASGSVGTVYKMQVGDLSYAFKINRNSLHGELYAMALQRRARGLVNQAHIGAVFEFGGRKYSWVLSDYVARDRADGFESAMEKLYFAYLTKGLTINDAHPGNFKDGKLIDIPSLDTRDNKVDDIKQLTRVEQNMVARLAYYIKTNDIEKFTKTVEMARTTNPAVINYMFVAMKFGRPPMFVAGNTNDFSLKLRRFESVIDMAYRANKRAPELSR